MTPKLYAFREYVTDKANFGIDQDGARIGDTPNIAMDAGTPELAHLISAAPDLLDALKQTIGLALSLYSDAVEDHRDSEYTEIVRNARKVAFAAIAKAEGRS